jgi:hypothetical protein
VATWFEVTLNDFIVDTFIVEQANGSTVIYESANTLGALGTNGEMAVSNVLQFLLDGAATIAETTGEGEPAAILMYMAADGLAFTAGSDDDDADDEVSGSYATIADRIGQMFVTAIDGNMTVEREVLGDYGLQLAIQQFISDGFWNNSAPLAKMTAGSQLAFTRWAWQQIGSSIWTLYISSQSPGGNYSSFYCGDQRGFCSYLAGPPSRRNDDQNTLYIPGAPVKQSVTQQLFGTVTCTESWDAATCALGFDPADIAFNRGGWSLQYTYCNQEETDDFVGFACDKPQSGTPQD